VSSDWPSRLLDVRTLLERSAGQMDQCQHNAHKGHVCFDGDERHELREDLREALRKLESPTPASPTQGMRE
jgi:hypothetical protein